MKYKHRILIFALMTGLAGTVMSLLLLWSADYTIRIQLALTLLILLAWLGLPFTLKSKVIFPLRTLSNLLGALREGDYSLQARGARHDDALGEVILEANALAESLREQRLGAIEAMALLRKIMAEINVAMFGFDSSHRLRLVNDNGKHLLGRTDEQLYNCHASELGLADCLDGATPRIVDLVFPGGFGTMDELFETLTLVQTGKMSPIPIILFDREFSTNGVNLDVFVNAGTISPDDRNLFHYAETAEEAWEHLVEGGILNETPLQADTHTVKPLI